MFLYGKYSNGRRQAEQLLGDGPGVMEASSLNCLAQAISCFELAGFS